MRSGMESIWPRKRASCGLVKRLKQKTGWYWRYDGITNLTFSDLPPQRHSPPRIRTGQDAPQTNIHANRDQSHLLQHSLAQWRRSPNLDQAAPGRSGDWWRLDPR